MAHNPATTDNPSAYRYLARTRRNRRSKTGQRRITRGLLPCSSSLTCTDSTADRSNGTDCTGFSQRTVPRPVPRIACGRRWAIAGGVAPTAAAGRSASGGLASPVSAQNQGPPSMAPGPGSSSTVPPGPCTTMSCDPNGNWYTSWKAQAEPEQRRDHDERSNSGKRLPARRGPAATWEKTLIASGAHSEHPGHEQVGHLCAAWPNSTADRLTGPSCGSTGPRGSPRGLLLRTTAAA